MVICHWPCDFRQQNILAQRIRPHTAIIMLKMLKVKNRVCLRVTRTVRPVSIDRSAGNIILQDVLLTHVDTLMHVAACYTPGHAQQSCKPFCPVLLKHNIPHRTFQQKKIFLRISYPESKYLFVLTMFMACLLFSLFVVLAVSMQELRKKCKQVQSMGCHNLEQQTNPVAKVL